LRNGGTRRRANRVEEERRDTSTRTQRTYATNSSLSGPEVRPPWSSRGRLVALVALVAR